MSLRTGKNKYQLMGTTENYKTDNGSLYPDVFTFDISSFIYSKRPLKYELREKDVYRFDRLMIEYYGSVDLYDEVVLWLNKVSFLDESWIGQTISLPIKSDISNFYFAQVR